MILHVLLLSVLALLELHRAESSTACVSNSDCKDESAECVGTVYVNGGVVELVNGKCLSSDDAVLFRRKLGKRCAASFEKAGGCPCRERNNPRCKASTDDEMNSFIPDECVYMKWAIFDYCEKRDEFCSGVSIDGLAHRRFISKSVCCHKDCPRCGGNRCGQQTDSSGKKLGQRKCCGRTILKREKVCGEHPAPCKVAVKGADVFEDFLEKES